MVMKRSDHQGEGATSAPSFTAPVMETINPLDVTEIEGLDGAEFEDEVEEDENGTEPAEEEDDDEQEEEKAPEEDDPVPWLDHNQTTKSTSSAMMNGWQKAPTRPRTAASSWFATLATRH